MNGNSTLKGYRVEVRDTSFEAHRTRPIVVNGYVMSEAWVEINCTPGRDRSLTPGGTLETVFETRNHFLADQLEPHNLYPYVVAEAIAIATAAAHPYSGIECRLVQYTLKQTYTLERNGLVDAEVITTDRDRGVKVIAETSEPKPAE